MRKNIEKFNYYKDIILNKEMSFISSQKLDIQNKYFDCSPVGNVFNIEITGLQYRYPRRISLFYGDKPTKEEVKRIAEFSQSDFQYKRGEIMIYYTEKHEKYECSGAVSLKEHEENQRWLSTIQEAKNKAKAVKKEREERERLLNNGHIACHYCGKIVPENQAVNYKIISYANYGKAGKMGQYCSGDCGVSDQMAHEG